MLGHRSRNSNQGTTDEETNLPISSGTSPISSQKVKRSVNAFWECPRDRVKILRRLGDGCFGTVNKAQILPFHSLTLIIGDIVAVKTLKSIQY